jgi:hypothetical protein
MRLICVAGIVAYSLTCALYHLLAQPAEAKKLQEELAGAGLVPGQIPSIGMSKYAIFLC